MLKKERRVKKMAWRNQSTHKEETKAVKDALQRAQIPVVSVHHGRGTAWSWLAINLGEGNDRYGDRAMAIAKSVTGRIGDYDGEIMIFTAPKGG